MGGKSRHGSQWRNYPRKSLGRRGAAKDTGRGQLDHHKAIQILATDFLQHIAPKVKGTPQVQGVAKALLLDGIRRGIMNRQILDHFANLSADEQSRLVELAESATDKSFALKKQIELIILQKKK